MGYVPNADVEVCPPPCGDRDRKQSNHVSRACCKLLRVEHGLLRCVTSLNIFHKAASVLLQLISYVWIGLVLWCCKCVLHPCTAWRYCTKQQRINHILKTRWTYLLVLPRKFEPLVLSSRHFLGIRYNRRPSLWGDLQGSSQRWRCGQQTWLLCWIQSTTLAKRWWSGATSRNRMTINCLCNNVATDERGISCMYTNDLAINQSLVCLFIEAARGVAHIPPSFAGEKLWRVIWAAATGGPYRN